MKQTFYVRHVRLDPAVGTCTHRVMAVYRVAARDGKAAISKTRRAGCLPIDSVEYLVAGYRLPVGFPKDEVKYVYE